MMNNGRAKKKAKRKHSTSKRQQDSEQNMSSEELNGCGSDEDMGVSDNSSNSSTSPNVTLDTTDDIEYYEDTASLIMSKIEEAKEQGGKERQLCCEEIRKALCSRCVPDAIVPNKKTILDFLEKSIRKGATEDRVLCCYISTLFCIQLGRRESAEVFATLKPILLPMIQDSLLPSSLRASAALALGLTCFVGADKTEDIVDCLSALKRVFCQKVPVDSTTHIVHGNALVAWGLLLTFATEFDIPEQIDDVVAVFCKIIERGDLNLRILAGETAALVFEVAAEIGVSLNEIAVNDLYSLLRDLSNEGGHHKGKREKRAQKTNFREILRSVEDGCFPDKTIRFGIESMDITSWVCSCKYNALKEVLASGINTHLQSNFVIREIFGLGAMVCKEDVEERTNKCEKEWLNAVTVKARKKSRSQQRDDKHAVLYECD